MSRFLIGSEGSRYYYGSVLVSPHDTLARRPQLSPALGPFLLAVLDQHFQKRSLTAAIQEESRHQRSADDGLKIHSPVEPSATWL